MNKAHHYLSTAIKAAFFAGKEIMAVYKEGFEVTLKEDNSPLTEADRKGHDKIISMLGSELPVLSEEGKTIPYSDRKKWELFWMVDPLDGTKEFIKRNGEFTVNIALIEKGKPVLGVIYAPALDQLYFACEGTGSFRLAADDTYIAHLLFSENITDRMIHASQKLPLKKLTDKYTVVASRSHMTEDTENFIAALRNQHGEVALISKGSSLKLCLVAEGSADVYPRFAPTMEWDIAAGHAIAKYAGLNAFNSDTGSELAYNKENLLNPWFIVKR